MESIPPDEPKKRVLGQLGISDTDLKELMDKLSGLQLNDDQKRILTSSLPTMEQAARTFDPEVAPAELQAVFSLVLGESAMTGANVGGYNPGKGKNSGI